MNARAVLVEYIQRHGDVSYVKMCFYKPAPPRVHTEDMHRSVLIAAEPAEGFIARVMEMKRELDIPDDWSISVTSQVIRTGLRQSHIPLLDFRERISDGGLALVSEKLTQIIRPELPQAFPGYILESGQSYHYIGLGALTPLQWMRFMGLALLCESHEKPLRHSPIDRLWLGHTLVRGFGVLRILPSPEKPYEPVVATRIE